jgi:hypothetical protein
VGEVVGVPRNPSNAFYADTVGTDSIKAILFTREECARSLIRSFERSPRLSRDGVREWKDTTIDSNAPFYTSELITQIVDDTTGLSL